MNHMNMSGFNPGNGALGNMPMPNHGPNGVGGRTPDDHEDTNYEAKLNAHIYGYYCFKGKWELARALKDSGLEFDPHLSDNANGANDNMQTDSKDGIDLKRPDDLPDFQQFGDRMGGSFLSSWFALFWDMFWAQRKNSRASANTMQYVNHTLQQARTRSEQQAQMLRAMPGMGPDHLNYQQMLRFQNVNGNLQRKALENNRQFQPTAHQLAQMQRSGMMQGMRRDPSDMDMNGQRPRTPSAGDHAPSPNKRQRLDGVPFNGAPHMMQNGRGPPGMPGQLMGGESAALNANHLLMNSGINPGNLSDSQFASFQQQNPAVQQKSIQVYAQNLAKTQRQQSMSNASGMSDQGSPLLSPGGMGIEVGGPEYYGGANPGAMQMRGVPPPGAPNGAAGGNHALQDYQMQLMLLEQQNKKRLLMARQEQDTIGSGRPDGPGGMPGAPGFAPGMSPSGSRGGPSPGPSDQARRGTPKMPQTTGIPGSPMPDGSMRGSPADMPPFNSIQPDMYSHMNGGGMRPPPSSHPQFNNGQNYPPEHMAAISKAQNGGRINGNWPGPPGQAPMIQAPPPQQGVQMGTPQQRNEMPPPQARPASPTAPPTPQTTSKANPKGKKDARERKKPPKKGSTASVPPTPASEAEQPPTPTPATPVTPQHSASFAPSKADGQGPAGMMPGMTSAAPDQLAPQPQDTAIPGFNGLDPGVDDYSMPFNSDLNNTDILENFDFEQFLQTTADGEFNFDPSTFEAGDGIEISGGS